MVHDSGHPLRSNLLTIRVIFGLKSTVVSKAKIDQNIKRIC